MRTISLQHNLYLFFAAFLAIGLFFWNPSPLLFAQDETPEAEKPAAEAAKPASDADKPAEKPDDESSKKADVPPSDPAVAALLATNPTTPSECAKTARILVDLHQPVVATQMLKKVLDAKLDKPQLAALGREIGSAAFLGFSQNEALQPLGKQLGDAVLDAMTAEYQDPQKIAAAIKLLQDESIDKRTVALQELQNAGNVGIAALIEVLADPQRKADFKNVRAALCTMGRPAIESLIGIISNADPQLKEQAIIVLGDMKAGDASLFLLFPLYEKFSHRRKAVAQTEDLARHDEAIRIAAEKALRRIGKGIPSVENAAKMLAETANDYFTRQKPIPGAVDGKVEIWKWEPEKRKCEISFLPVEDAVRFRAARLAEEAFLLDIKNIEARRIYFAATLEASIYRDGLDNSKSNRERQDDLLGISTKNVYDGFGQYEDLLEYCIATQHYPAATITAELLGSFKKPDQLLNPEKGQSILVQAVQQPDRRLRMAAIKAIVKLNPQKPYPGSSNVTQALAFFASGTGTRRALAAGPNLNNIPKLVSGLSALGFTVDTVNTGKEVMQKLLASPDYEIAMIDAGVSRPEIEELVQQIRRDDRSADVRVGIVARAGFFDKAEHAAKSDPLALDFPRPNEDDAVHWEAEKLAALKPRDLVKPEERLRQAGEALDILAELSRTSSKLYDIRRIQSSVLGAMNTPTLAAKAVAVLANINSPESQQALVETASRDTTPLELRKAAADAFRANVKANGILLKTEEIRRQYDRYNQSEKAGEETQKILGEILDSLESKK